MFQVAAVKDEGVLYGIGSVFDCHGSYSDLLRPGCLRTAASGDRRVPGRIPAVNGIALGVLHGHNPQSFMDCLYVMPVTLYRHRILLSGQNDHLPKITSQVSHCICSGEIPVLEVFQELPAMAKQEVYFCPVVDVLSPVIMAFHGMLPAPGKLIKC